MSCASAVPPLDCAPPDYTRCLLALSPQGGDEVEFREFDLATGKFVEGGFRTPQSRAFASLARQGPAADPAYGQRRPGAGNGLAGQCRDLAARHAA